ncbi:hypothetical protein TCAP_01981 [Tolypocladium capitatum]|uniref:Uncharacterized protein n=1 Tax=Tolypocladium capitatum TaxID=45235 RepID=A0A2K3QKM8_9HYPO|nr:hypothetical protein TCAP_01981 [Tolypocladium capitatum]
MSQPLYRRLGHALRSPSELLLRTHTSKPRRRETKVSSDQLTRNRSVIIFFNPGFLGFVVADLPRPLNGAPSHVFSTRGLGFLRRFLRDVIVPQQIRTRTRTRRRQSEPRFFEAPFHLLV